MFRTVIVMLALAPGGAFGASDAISLSCTIVKSCDTDGNCTGNGRQVAFKFMPERVNDQGEGVYHLTTDDFETDAFFFSEAGPVVWSRTSEDVQTMAFTSEQSLVWTDARFGAQPGSETHFLKCEAR
jgi:hypothetical protein